MQVDRETLFKIAHLARLEVREKEISDYLMDLSTVLSWMEKLNQLDTSEIESYYTLSKNENHLREDKVYQELSREQALSNAPNHDKTFIKVPKVIDQSS